MDIKVSHCFILVDDHEKALGFYRDVLGFEVRNDISFEGMRWVTVVPPSQPELQITIETVDSNPEASPEDKQKQADLLAKGMLRGLVFTTDDVDAAFEHIKASGAEVLEEPTDQAYGVRDCAFRDPAGNMIRLNQPKVSTRKKA
ncbi:MAG: VOC family protein [Hamadaea sp.]|uniref:VOC family protein n=1 Tax=Hamadaea sp. TaxID=2024425 RepID=UPI0017F91529|nr:VOC family protein [Hamadaea sp.]NUR74074.1 VOC family protein [Hamadaea sp.]NUT23966.1 VOC family protein [Hamadaea sp.]